MVRVFFVFFWGIEGVGRMGVGSGVFVISFFFVVFGMVFFLTFILNIMLFMLGMVKYDTMRVVFCCGKMVFTGRGWVLFVYFLVFCFYCFFGRGRGFFRRRRWVE